MDNGTCATCRYCQFMPQMIPRIKAICICPEKDVKKTDIIDSCTFWQDIEDHAIDMQTNARLALADCLAAEGEEDTKADKILREIMNGADHSRDKNGSTVLEIYADSTDKRAVRDLFSLFTGVDLMDFTKRCLGKEE